MEPLSIYFVNSISALAVVAHFLFLIKISSLYLSFRRSSYLEELLNWRGGTEGKEIN